MGVKNESKIDFTVAEEQKPSLLLFINTKSLILKTVTLTTLITLGHHLLLLCIAYYFPKLIQKQALGKH